MFRTLVLMLGLILGGTSAVAAQEAMVTGIVTDQSAGMLPGVTVTARELGTGRTVVAVTNDAGEYQIRTLQAGRYEVKAELAGFASVVLPQVELLVGQNANIPFVMGLASLQEAVTVTSEAPFVDIRSAQVAGNVDRRQMEELPIQGRNWMELSMMVKGITANNVDTQPGVVRDEQFQLNLDGQQITQRAASSGFGQPRFSREAIAEFQIVTSLFDITQGRSSGIQVNAVTKSGTNNLSGSAYGFFRSDKFNAKDHVASRVLPYENQQAGLTLGGPVILDKAHYFVSYEYERSPETIFAQPPLLPRQSFQFGSTQTQHSLMGRADLILSQKDIVSVRGSLWKWENPFSLGSTAHPSAAAQRSRDAMNVLGTWSKVLTNSMTQEIKVGYNAYNWANLLAVPSFAAQPSYSFPGITFGGPGNFPQAFHQDVASVRYDLTATRGRHDFKLGGEFLGWWDSGFWEIFSRGSVVFAAAPPDLERRFPASAWDNPSLWDVSGLDSLAIRFDQTVGDWTVDTPRPTWDVWIGDTWRTTNRLTLTYGVRWDVDWNAFSPPGPYNDQTFVPFGGPLYRNDNRDLNNVAPRFGAVYKVQDGSQEMVLRGGSGIFYGAPVSNLAWLQQAFNGVRLLSNSYPNDGRPGFVLDPTRGITEADIRSGRVPVPPQNPFVIAHDYRVGYTWQSSVGFQKQVGTALGVEADLTYWRAYNEKREYDINLFFDPGTNYNRDPARFGRPDPKFGETRWMESTGSAEYLGLSSAVTRRFRDDFQWAATYTLMFDKNDNAPGYEFGFFPNNPFDLDAEWARSADFQRHTLRFNGLYRFPWSISVAGAYFFGSGNYFATTIAGRPFGKPGANRLNIGAPMAVPAQVDDRFEGPAVIGTGELVPRNALRGRPLHKVDVRVSKDIQLWGDARVSVLAEVFNVFNHANFGSYVGDLTAVRFGLPVQNTGSAYVPRSGQFGVRVSF